MRDRDSQRSKVYEWEQRSMFGDGCAPITIEQCEQIAELIRRAYGLQRAIPVRLSTRERGASANYSGITTSTWGMKREVMLHELAHVIVTRNGKSGCAAHGPEFMRVYFDLLVHYTGRPARELRKSITAAKIKMAPASKVPQPKVAVRHHNLTKLDRLPAPKRKPKRCPKHDWLQFATISRKLTTKGMVVTYQVRCRQCRKLVPSATAA